jgi:DNA-binding transcriptional regulator YiaG
MAHYRAVTSDPNADHLRQGDNKRAGSAVIPKHRDLSKPRLRAIRQRVAIHV